MLRTGRDGHGSCRAEEEALYGTAMRRDFALPADGQSIRVWGELSPLGFEERGVNGALL